MPDIIMKTWKQPNYIFCILCLENTQNELSLTRSTAVLVDLKQDMNERIIIS